MKIKAFDVLKDDSFRPFYIEVVFDYKEEAVTWIRCINEGVSFRQFPGASRIYDLIKERLLERLQP